jgi:hypothetical protein
LFYIHHSLTYLDIYKANSLPTLKIEIVLKIGQQSGTPGTILGQPIANHYPDVI